ncbi:hypothetical protein L2E82_04946 [Cichorium intybus]|uniref:Uncharacterized protein n=1 Tax=Cichorium intybus TaxID=13427 RepID=A0ACB9H7D4_CICIN|nr:hypothetical protein L2E82_04946 [Cichorium intybus]
MQTSPSPMQTSYCRYDFHADMISDKETGLFFSGSFFSGYVGTGDRRGVVPASGFSFSAQQIWEVIMENKDLNLQTHKVMVATVICEEIANEKYSFFVTNEIQFLFQIHFSVHILYKILNQLQML